MEYNNIHIDVDEFLEKNGGKVNLVIGEDGVVSTKVEEPTGNQKPKKKKGFKVFCTVLAVLMASMVTINVIPPKKNIENNPFIVAEGALPMIAAHRGGGKTNPENTILAFREAVTTYGADIIESDVYLTKDGYLVYNHDAYIDETCNVNGDMPLEKVKSFSDDQRHYIKDMTLLELETYNFGYYFEKDGERIYKNETILEKRGLQIATVDKLFEEFYETHPNLKFIVEIKDEGEIGYKACRVLYEALQKYPNYIDNIVVGTFHDEIEEELKTNYPQLMRGAPTGTATKFVLTQYFGVNILDNSDFACLQIPMSYKLLGVEVGLTSKLLIDRAHRRNIAVQYWTINDADEMRQLIELGCDAIMTDDPILLKSVLAEYKGK